LDTFFPAKDRQELVLVLNNLLASPSTAAFRAGEPIDIDAWLGGPASAPKLSILALAHLGDAERIFVLATVLSRVKAWMRSQPGSGTLRAVIYIDEIWGFFPPSAEPPTKKPLLTLLKQARAFGIGVVLATQNPVDLDYKGLANCGIWCVGTLQTERDRQRLTEGLRAASGSDAAEALLSQTKKRVFLLHDVHRKAPCLLETRWAMSYLKGPMTKDELARFAPQAAGPQAAAPQAAASQAAAPPPLRGEPAEAGGSPPPLSVTWPVKFVAGRGAQVAKPHLYVRYAVAYRSGKARSPESSGVKLFPLDVGNPFEVLEGDALDIAPEALLDDAPRASRYGEVPSWLSAQGGKSAEKAVKERLSEKLAAQLLRDPISGELSARGESPEEFAARVAPLVKPPLALQQRVARKAQELATAEADAKQRSMETWTSMAGAAVDVLGGLFGGKKKSIRVGKVGSTLSKKRQEENADAKVERLRQELADLEGQLAPPSAERFETVEIVPAKTHVDVLGIGLAWVR
ncbi:MAG: ATP-binding protein, partial [Acidobacteria bacterium]|nr:ATP-binding protein [Acidobacteriota bacterium]